MGKIWKLHFTISRKENKTECIGKNILKYCVEKMK